MNSKRLTSCQLSRKPAFSESDLSFVEDKSEQSSKAVSVKGRYFDKNDGDLSRADKAHIEHCKILTSHHIRFEFIQVDCSSNDVSYLSSN